MGDVVNLRQFRKQKQRTEKQKKAQSNRLKHGQSKAVRDLEEVRRKIDDAAHAGHLIEPEDDGPQPA